MQKETWRIAVAQLAVVDGDKDANLEKMENALKKASRESADMIIFPELVLTGLVSDEEINSIAEPREGESFKQIQKMIENHPMYVLYSFPEFVSEEEIYITTCLMDKNGRALSYYRKTHLFTDENNIFSKGNDLPKITIGDLTIGLLTCYDIELPEPARSLALQGVNLLLVNSANMAPYEYIHRLFICSRALENQCFVVYCNRTGSNEFYEYRGQSAAVGPDGRIIADLGEGSDAVSIAVLSISEIRESKSVFNYIADRRPELYRLNE